MFMSNSSVFSSAINNSVFFVCCVHVSGNLVLFVVYALFLCIKLLYFFDFANMSATPHTVV